MQSFCIDLFANARTLKADNSALEVVNVVHTRTDSSGLNLSS